MDGALLPVKFSSETMAPGSYQTEAAHPSRASVCLCFSGGLGCVFCTALALSRDTALTVL